MNEIQALMQLQVAVGCVRAVLVTDEVSMLQEFEPYL